MPFLALVAAVFAFAIIFPGAFKVFYWILMLGVYTLGPACFLYLFFALTPLHVSFTLCIVGSFFVFGLPITKYFAPGE